MTKVEKKKLANSAKAAFNAASDDDTIVLCVNGVETDNDYPMYCCYEPDCKSPVDWVNSICFACDMGEYSGELSFKIKKN